ncbi:MAG: Gfo/Idh/MocA family oxidoreductase, partial [Solirubrobacterales bacterium]
MGLQKRLTHPDELRLGVAGCGRIVERGYVAAALATPGVRIAAFADPDARRLRQCQDLWERGADAAAGFADAAELLAAAPVDALIVASPAASHVAV